MDPLAIEAELQHERAASLGRAGRALERALAQWRASPDETNLKEAKTRLWHLVVQREALGLYHHRDVYEHYGVPRGWY